MTEHCNDVHAFSNYSVKRVYEHPKSLRQEKLKEDVMHGMALHMLECLNMFRPVLRNTAKPLKCKHAPKPAGVQVIL